MEWIYFEDQLSPENYNIDSFLTGFFIIALSNSKYAFLFKVETTHQPLESNHFTIFIYFTCIANTVNYYRFEWASPHIIQRYISSIKL